MPRHRPLTSPRLKKSRKDKAEKPATLPSHFEPKFLDLDCDQRQSTIQLIRRRLERLKSEAGCDSFQKEMLAEQAIFISVQLETMKVNALMGQPFDGGSFTVMVNCLSGLLNKLGLKKADVIGGKLTLAQIREGKG